MTKYRILRPNPEISGWVEVGIETASNPKHALRLLNERSPLDATDYVVVPDRNWTQLHVEVETETRLVFVP